MLTLQKTPGKDFVLLNLSDPQLGDGEWAPDHPNRKILTGTVTELVKRLDPDLITVSGDLAWAGNFEAYRLFGEFLDTFGKPWTCCWGNHDNQGGPDKVNAVVDEYLTHPLFIYEKGDPALGNGNFVIRIEENGKPVEGVIVMDSHDRMPWVNEKGEEVTDWAKLIPEQLVWYEEQIRALEAEGCTDTTIITHIPIYGYRPAFAAAFRADRKPEEVKPSSSTGAEFWNPGYEDSFGVKYEGICSYPEDEGMLDLIEKLGSTKHYIAGHDHVNNYVIRYRGVKLIYSLKAGPGCYWNPVLNGGTVLTIGENGVNGVRHEFVDPAAFTE